MALDEKWATPEDFATLFQYFWYHDFPIDQKAIGAHRADWTIHIGIVVRNVADLMGLVTRFEHGGRTDAVLRSTDGDEIALEWEWGGVWYNEIKKLREHKIWSTNKTSERLLKYAVLITYTHTPNIEGVYKHVEEKWAGAKWPLLLVLIDVRKVAKATLSIGKEFQDIQTSIFDGNGRRKLLRKAPARPWKVDCTRWSYMATSDK
jgi:hypothetical protein